MTKLMDTKGLFAPNPSKQESKANTTNSIARAIVDDEVKRREAKTARLREMRLKMEADAQPPAAPARKPVKKRA